MYFLSVSSVVSLPRTSVWFLFFGLEAKEKDKDEDSFAFKMTSHIVKNLLVGVMCACFISCAVRTSRG